MNDNDDDESSLSLMLQNVEASRAPICALFSLRMLRERSKTIDIKVIREQGKPKNERKSREKKIYFWYTTTMMFPFGFIFQDTIFFYFSCFPRN